MRAALLVLSLLLALVSGCTNLLDLEERRVRDGGGLAAGCDDYCTQAELVCPGLFYKNDVGCRGICAAYPLGDPKQPKPMENTLACRSKALENARIYNTEPMTYCPGAGPAGSPGGAVTQTADTCGTLCDNYCDLYQRVCPELATPDCKSKCPLLPDRAGSDTAQMDFESGADTVQCRLAHVTAAATAKSVLAEDMRKVHCGHSGLKSNVLCDVNDEMLGIEIQCADFCKLTMGVCQGPNQVYEIKEQCEAVCTQLPAGKLAELDLRTDSRRCRRANAYKALLTTEPAEVAGFCSDASPVTALCGAGRCETYCALAAKSGCTAQFAQQFGTTDPTEKCKMNCRALSDTGNDVNYSIAAASTRGSPLSCRGLHAARALAATVAGKPITAGTCEAAMGLPAPGGLPTACQ